MAWPWRQPRLFWRLYLGGLALLGLVFGAILAVGAVTSRGPIPRSPDKLARYAAEHVTTPHEDGSRIESEFRQMADAFRVEIAYRLDDGTVVATAGSPPTVPAAELAKLGAGPLHLEMDGRTVAVAHVAGKSPGYVVVATPPRPFPLERTAALVSALLLVLALSAFPMARALARPMETLTEAARRLGAGDLAARSGLRRDDEVGELSAAFDEMAERLQGLVRAERQLLADVSHELRTPIARIRVALDLAAEGDVARARKYLEAIRIDLADLERLLEDVLATARLDQAGGNGTVPLRLEPVRAVEQIERVASLFRTEHPTRALTVKIEGELPTFEADPSMVRRALLNVLENAAKYSEPPAPIEIHARSEEGALVVEVRDRGIGIEAQDLPRLFTPFFRTDRSRARETGGVGLGLALTRRIVEAHGGSVVVESQPGVGTTVRFRVPPAN